MKPTLAYDGKPTRPAKDHSSTTKPVTDHGRTITRIGWGGKISLNAYCYGCGAEAVYTGNNRAYQQWRLGERRTEDVFKNLPQADRYFLLSGICHDCQPTP